MGGWVVIIGDHPSLDPCLSKFQKVFSVNGVPSLRIEVFSNFSRMKSFGWAWNTHGVPDVYYRTSDKNSIVLCGAITDLGNFGQLPTTQEHTVDRVLQLWEENKEDVIKNINGSFSCLFYDHTTQQVNVYTDRFASRSIWLGDENGNWIIGNFPSAIVSVMKNTPRLNPSGLWSLLHAGRRVGNRGLFANVQTLMAGQKAKLAFHGNMEISYWWRRRYEPREGLSPRMWGKIIAEAIKSSANRYKQTATSPYLYLSGGLDSRIVAAGYKQPLKTISLCTNPNAETRIASMVSKVLNLDNQRIVRSLYWYLDTSDASSLISSGCHLNQHTHFIVPTQKIVSENSNAEFLLGDLLENFNKHYFSVSENQGLNFNPKNICSFLYSSVPYTIKFRNRIGRLINKDIKEKIESEYKYVLEEYANSIVEVSPDHADRFDTFLRWANVSVTPTYNMITCIWPLAEERNIYFDTELDDVSLKIPSKIRRAGVLHNWILYYLSKRLVFIPDANTFVPPFFPKRINNMLKEIRPSVGRVLRSASKRVSKTPVLKTSGSWILLHEVNRKNLDFRRNIENLFFDSSIFPPDLFNKCEIINIWNQYLAGNINLHFEVEALKSFGNLHKLIPCNGIDF